jgi:uncharacterized membrane protein
VAFWVLVALVVALFALRRALTAEKALDEQRRELVELRRMVQTLADRLGERWPGAPPPPAPHASEQHATPEAMPGVMPAVAEPLPFAEPAASTPLEPTALFEQAAAREQAAPHEEAAPHGQAAAPAAPPAPPPLNVKFPSLPSAAARQMANADSLESAIGGRWLLYIGIAAIVLGASYFLKYAFDNDWIGQHTRVLFGVAGGVALTVLGRRFVHRGH